MGGRRTLTCLICGAALSLLLLVIIPHPVPSSRAQKSLGHRRIHQEENDYTGSKHMPQADTGVGHVEEVSKKTSVPAVGKPVEPNNTKKDAKLVAQEQVVDIPRVKTKGENAVLAKAQETALTALQHGFKLTEGQKKMVEQLSPQERRKLEAKASKARATQEKVYIQQLRAKKQIRPRKGGGEEVISTPQMPIRFPASLKKVHPRDWLLQYKLFLNLTHYPWTKTNSCSNSSITFAPTDTLPPRALASFPSSGNTWIRYLVESASGIFTGSFYDDTSLMKKGMYGEGIVYNSGMTILQKTHGYTTGDYMKVPHSERVDKNHIAEMGHQGVVVIRNPFKALISHRHLDIGGHTGYAPKAHFIGQGWSEFVTLKILLWKDFYMDWIKLTEDYENEEFRKQKEKIHIVYYENVKEDPVRELRKILTYLDIPVDEERLRCLGEHSDWGLFKRKPSKNVPLDMNPYTMELKNLIYEAIDEVNQALLDRERRRERIGGDRRGLESSSIDKPSDLPPPLSPPPPQLLPLSLYEFYDSREAEVARGIRRKRGQGAT